MEKSQISRANKSVLLMNIVLFVVLAAGYIVDYFKGNKTLGYILLFCGIILLIGLIDTAIYIRNRESRYLKYVTLVFFMFIYTFAMFSATRVLVYAYIFPIISIYILYFDLRLMSVLCG
ncbi:MAG: hypothetical protein ACOZCL_05295 [Bacillota bacterium]